MTWGYIPTKWINNLNIRSLTEIAEMQSSIKLDNLSYSTSANNHNFSKYSLPTVLKFDESLMKYVRNRTN